MHPTAHTPQVSAHQDSALQSLADRSWRLAAVVEQSSRRKDVQEKRAQILLLLLALRCPPGCRPSKRWYVPGAVARLGSGGLQRAWRGYLGCEPPTLRTIQSHMGELERLCLVVRAPGDWLPYFDPEHPERRPRYPDTIHLLDDEEASVWWQRIGLPVLREHPEARTSPDRWKMLVGSWRSQSRARQLDLFEDAAPAASTPRRVEAIRNPVLGRALCAAARAAAGPLEILGLLARAGAQVRGKASFAIAARPERLRGAAALLGRALERGDRIRNPAAWLLIAARHAPPAELAAALGTTTTRRPSP